jgi:glycosyltransferase involved in cell wall biosynthesis
MNPHGAIAAKLEGKKVVWQLIDTRSPFLLMVLLMPLVAMLADAVMATGRKTVAAHPMNRLIRNRLHFFYPPVDLNRFSFNSDVKSKARKAIGLSPEDIVVGTVGTINPQKGHRCFIDAAKMLLVQHPNVKFVIIGSELETQKEYAAAIRRFAVEQGLVLGRNLFFIDPEDRVHFFEQALNFFWMTSVPRSEGIPTAIEEAMALGLPVIGTDVGSVSEIVRHGETGYVVAPQDACAIADHTGYLISHTEVMKAFGREAKKTAPVFSTQNCADRHYECYRFCQT